MVIPFCVYRYKIDILDPYTHKFTEQRLTSKMVLQIRAIQVFDAY
jgi:hypothetical protein